MRAKRCTRALIFPVTAAIILMGAAAAAAAPQGPPASANAAPYRVERGGSEEDANEETPWFEAVDIYADTSGSLLETEGAADSELEALGILRESFPSASVYTFGEDVYEQGGIPAFKGLYTDLNRLLEVIAESLLEPAGAEGARAVIVLSDMKHDPAIPAESRFLDSLAEIDVGGSRVYLLRIAEPGDAYLREGLAPGISLWSAPPEAVPRAAVEISGQVAYDGEQMRAAETARLSGVVDSSEPETVAQPETGWGWSRYLLLALSLAVALCLAALALRRARRLQPHRRPLDWIYYPNGGRPLAGRSMLLLPFHAYLDELGVPVGEPILASAGRGGRLEMFPPPSLTCRTQEVEGGGLCLALPGGVLYLRIAASREARGKDNGSWLSGPLTELRGGEEHEQEITGSGDGGFLPR